MLQRMNTNHLDLEQKLMVTEQENEKLREQAFKADREVDRLKENIILREREIHNIKKSIANDRMRESNGRNKSKQSELGFTFESNPNLVNEFAKMTGSSGFKYNQKGPYDESIEKLMKEFNVQQKELGIETVSEASLDRKEESLISPNNNKNIYALMMGQSVHKPTGNIKVDYEALLKENNDLKIVVKTMREEMENIANNMNRDNARNSEYLSPEDAKKKLDFDYLNSNNLRHHDLKQENDSLKEQISRMKLELISKSDIPGTVSAALIQRENTIKELKRKLDEKRDIIAKLKEERDNLVNICSEMKIQLCSMRKNEEYRQMQNNEQYENRSPNQRGVSSTRNGGQSALDSKGKGVDFKKKLDSLGDHVKELFSEFKSALNHPKRPADIFSNRPQIKGKVSIQPDKVKNLLDKFENIQRDINMEKSSPSSSKKSKRKSTSKKKVPLKKSKSPIRGIALSLMKRDKSKEQR